MSFRQPVQQAFMVAFCAVLFAAVFVIRLIQVAG